MLPVIYIDNLFSYHAPVGDQPTRYEAIRDAAKTFALVLVSNTPESADQTAALRKLREAVMTANAAIALGPPTLGVPTSGGVCETLIQPK